MSPKNPQDIHSFKGALMCTNRNDHMTVWTDRKHPLVLSLITAYLLLNWKNSGNLYSYTVLPLLMILFHHSKRQTTAIS